MIFSYDWLQSFFKKRLPKPEKLAKLLTMYFFEVESLGKKGKDWVFDIDVLPNRASDCFSHLGIAREIAVIINTNCQHPRSIIKEDQRQKAKDFVQVQVKNKPACPRYTARVVTDVKVGSSPKWVKARLKVCGLKPINNVVDIANYVMLETGQPLHTFDGQKLEGRKIVVRLAKKRERIITLDEERYDLNEDILVIADAKKPVAIAGIKGGKNPEINRKTKIVILESANFNPRVVRKASRKLDLKTDASLRFEHGIDPNLTELAINKAASLIQEIAGGRITQGLVDFYPKKVSPKRIKLDFDYVERLLGVKISTKEIKNILRRLQFKTIENGSRWILVEVPTFRLDISIPEDLIEEIGRIYGYQKIPSHFPIAALIPPKRNLDIFWENMAKDILKQAGFTEVYNYSFIGEKEAKIFGAKNLIEVENPVSIEQKYLRASLLPNLLKNIRNNIKELPEIKIFELGKVFKKTKDLKEKRMLGGAIIGDAFFEAKGVIDLLLNKFGISNIWYDEYQPTPEESKLSIWQPQKCAEIKVNRMEIGFLGEILPKILDDFKISSKVVVFDLDFEKLQKLTSEEQEYQPISSYPAAVRDIAILVPRMVRVEEVLNIINAAGSSLIRDVDLFDIYEGEELPEGKKNLAFHIVYQSESKTLSSREINKIHQKIIKTLEENPGWEVRR